MNIQTRSKFVEYEFPYNKSLVEGLKICDEKDLKTRTDKKAGKVYLDKGKNKG
ncbi:hypothetical protein [Candidatus Methanoperedens nitratireducens]|uniref:Uncharacterized protein n=1 Tax=Candidatus Methanoperedens nitratireducens TaxID=1392998 RepID=A0A284VQR0_9EURY|nr:hypothetical protein [Candidatus Methanoperedens nitroreducens]SNQ61624.1 hypothetical protein MNV_420008 [Candidatus Methanoperedens nitroreducens]